MPFEDYKSKKKVDTVKPEIFTGDLISLLFFFLANLSKNFNPWLFLI